MTLRVWIPRAPGGEFLPALASFLEDAAVVVETGALPDEPESIRILVEGVPKDDQLDALPNLEAVVIPYAGVPKATRAPLLARRHLSLHNIHHNSAQTAELALALLLAAAKRVVPFDRALRQGDWRPRYAQPESVLLDGKSALVLGYGAIGKRVARALVGIGMTVTAVRRTATSASDGAVLLTGDVDAALASSDVVVVCLPATPATEGFLDRARLSRLPEGAIVVNVGRGPIVEEVALHELLTSGRLGAAGIDVWYQYPKSEDERAQTAPSTAGLHTLDNVVLSPHRAGQTRETERLRARHVADLLLARARGEPMGGRVDLEAGY